MLKICNLSMSVEHDEQQLRKKIARHLSVPVSELGELQLVRQSVDARRKNQIHLVLTVQAEVADETAVLRRNPRGVSVIEHEEYSFPAVSRTSDKRPVVVGMGPAGLFCALYLARSGIPCTLLERGRCVEERTVDVNHFWCSGELDCSSNVQFGEGGAGTFSDGKLTTGTHDGRIQTVLESLVKAGAPEDILYSHKPHIGTDVLRHVVRNVRMELIRLGCEVRFETRMIDLLSDGTAVTGVCVDTANGREVIETDAVILAIGHSARDTFEMLSKKGIPMQSKPFAIGVRIEHDQNAISRAQYGPVWDKLPPSDYKLSCHLPSGRSAYTFCVCPGGQVVASASEQGRLVTNGMSCRARDGQNINGGFLVGINPADFRDTDPLAGMRFQQHWEELAFQAGGGGFRAPAQLTGDFLAGHASSSCGGIAPTYLPGVNWSNLDSCLPGYVAASLREAIPVFDCKVRGFAEPESVLTGIETRSSSPVRILRDEFLQSRMRGVFPCGEGCGYAGGIVSAAVDGIRVAEAVAAGSTSKL